MASCQVYVVHGRKVCPAEDSIPTRPFYLLKKEVQTCNSVNNEKKKKQTHTQKKVVPDKKICS